jgi:CHAD domain-containing protein
VRRLLPVVELEVETQSLRLLGDEDKTLIRLAIKACRTQGLERVLTPRLTLTPLKGYEAQARAVAAWLVADLALEPAARPLAAEALDAAERPPGGYSSKLDFRLDPAQRGDTAAREVLLGLLDTLEANIPGARENLDSEFLHDLRVATRRTRAALAQVPGVLPAPVEADFKARFAWLQQVTGPVRDLDVYLLDFDAYQASLPPPMRANLEPLRAYVLAHYGAEQARLAVALGSVPMADLMRDWRRVLADPGPVVLEPANAARPVKGLADERIWRMVRRVRKEGRAIDRDSPAEAMHELRKNCKKLRYLMEFFQSLYPGDGIGGAIKLLKLLLDNLGGFQDLAVQAAHLRDLATRMQAERQADTAALLAMGALVADLLRRREAARGAFAETFRGFDSAEGRALFRGLFHAQAEPVPDPPAGAAG